MYTHFHTVNWNFNEQYSHDSFAYYTSDIDTHCICEFKTANGYEYYVCSDYQMKNSLLGEYAGCIKIDVNECKNVFVRNHDTETESTISLNDQNYLDD